MNPRHRTLPDLTLGFLTQGANTGAMEALLGAAAAGFGAVSPRVSGRHPGEPWPELNGDPQAFRKVGQAAARHGVKVTSATGYFLSPRTTVDDLLATVHRAREVGAQRILQGIFEPDRSRAVDLLRTMATAAADAGLTIAIEFMPMSEVKSLAATREVIADCGMGNVGILIDTLHLARSGGTAADVEALPPALVHLLQLSDATAKLAPTTTILEESMVGRMHLGDGELDLAGIVRAVPAATEIEIETPVIAESQLPMDQRAQRAAHAAQRFYDTHFR